MDTFTDKIARLERMADDAEERLLSPDREAIAAVLKSHGELRAIVQQLARVWTVDTDQITLIRLVNEADALISKATHGR